MYFHTWATFLLESLYTQPQWKWKASYATISALLHVTNKTIDTKARFLRPGYLPLTFMVTSQLTREAEWEWHSVVRTQQDSATNTYSIKNCHSVETNYHFYLR